MIKLAYCDFIAHHIKKALESTHSCSSLDGVVITSVSKVNYDLDSNGSFKSTKKTLTVQDHNNKLYKVTVEEIE
jgi:hypothetical protein